MTQMTKSDVAALLRRNDGFLILTHTRPDGDTLGTAGALCHALRRMGKTAYLFDNPGVTAKYVPFVAPYLAPQGFAPDYVVSVDLADEKLLPTTDFAVDLCVDHHPTNTFYAKNTFVMAEKASCGEIMLEILKELCGGIDREEADLLYVAISTDTGCFVYANTRADTHRAAAEVIDAGADMARLNKLLFRTVRRERLLLEGMAYAGLRSYRDSRVNVITIDLGMMAKSGATEDDCDDIASLPGKVAGSKMSFVIRELTPGFCKISARCSEPYDVSAICKKYGGGGHKLASGCEIAASPAECAEIMRREAEAVVE